MALKKISHSTYMQALACFTVAHRHYQKSREMEAEMGELLGFDDPTYAECVSDQIYDGGSFDDGLKRQGITVEPKKAKTKKR